MVQPFLTAALLDLSAKTYAASEPALGTGGP
jgi:hypothetical protein